MRRPPQLSNARAGAVLLLVIGAFVYFAFGGPLPFRHQFTVNAAFRNTLNLRPGSPVRIAGVNIGSVTAVRSFHQGDEPALVTMTIDTHGLPLHRDAVFAIRPRTFLEGNLFVDAQPGSPGAPLLHSGDVIPVNQTGSSVQLGEVLTALQADTRHDLQTALHVLARASQESAVNAFNRSIRRWPAAYKNTALVADASLGSAPDDVRSLIRSTGAVAAAADRHPAALRTLIRDLNVTSGALASEQANLGRTVAELPRTLHAAGPALQTVNALLPPLRRLAVAALPGVRGAGPALTLGRPLLDQLAGLSAPGELGGLIPQLASVVPAAAQLSTTAVSLLDQLRLAGSCTTHVLLPSSNQTIQDAAFPATGPVYQELVKALPGVAGESRTMDANGQWIRVLFGSGNYAYPDTGGRFMLTTSPLGGVNPAPPPARPKVRSDVPCETQQAPDLRSIPAPPPPGFAINDTSTAALALQSRAVTAANHFVAKLIHHAGLQRTLKVSDQLLTAGQIPGLSRTGRGR